MFRVEYTQYFSVPLFPFRKGGEWQKKKRIGNRACGVSVVDVRAIFFVVSSFPEP